jgi:hypothetical protein
MVGRFNGKYYVVDLDHMKFLYGPFQRRATADARLKRLAKRIERKNPRKKKLTVAKAKQILHEGRARGHKLTAKQRKFFGARLSRYPVPKISRYSKTRVNPGKRTLIYGRVLKIYAQKTSGPYRGQRFIHTFKRGALMYGMADGSLKIIHP